MTQSLQDFVATPAFDPRELGRLRTQASQMPQSSDMQRQVARQFEALFLNMMIQRMRDATPQDGLFNSSQTRLAQSLADQQLSSSLANPGIGLAQALLKQMQQGLGQQTTGGLVSTQVAGSQQTASVQANAAAWLGFLDGFTQRKAEIEGRASAASSPAPGGGILGKVADFVGRLVPAAREAARASGIPIKLILGQAALESGWGAREIKHPDGAPSHNLFGIKAGSNWRGATVDAVTTEFEQGVARKVTQTFRAYASYAEAFQDYARLIAGSPRYAAVRQASDHNDAARRIAQSGYATDPNYADKLIRVMSMMDGRG